MIMCRLASSSAKGISGSDGVFPTRADSSPSRNQISGEGWDFVLIP